MTPQAQVAYDRTRNFLMWLTLWGKLRRYGMSDVIMRLYPTAAALKN